MKKKYTYRLEAGLEYSHRRKSPEPVPLSGCPNQNQAQSAGKERPQLTLVPYLEHSKLFKNKTKNKWKQIKICRETLPQKYGFPPHFSCFFSTSKRINNLFTEDTDNIHHAEQMERGCSFGIQLQCNTKHMPSE